MRFTKPLAAVALVGLLAACQQPGGLGTTPDTNRALIGAAAGAVTAKAFDQSVGKGALLGAAAGALCDDAGVCTY
ncbi:YMGG-like glycine zipper-containing protein [Paracoccus sp. p4-l81]|uniref:YMGG-like glycine zipper-containing protein n=1 Tax=unclassified Paracoccus (in: a-proteobacteria) TaxID=2688777 RepID=UPI0035B91480